MDGASAAMVRAGVMRSARYGRGLFVGHGEDTIPSRKEAHRRDNPGIEAKEKRDAMAAPPSLEQLVEGEEATAARRILLTELAIAWPDATRGR